MAYEVKRECGFGKSMQRGFQACRVTGVICDMQNLHLLKLRRSGKFFGVCNFA